MHDIEARSIVFNVGGGTLKKLTSTNRSSQNHETVLIRRVGKE